MKRNVLAVAAIGVLLLCGCSGNAGGGDAAETIKIGASLPLTGPLSSFGPSIQEGYQAAVDDTNAAGGIEIDGVKHDAELVVLDSASDPTKVADQSKTMILQDGVVGLLGSVSPPLAIPASNTAELEKVPFVGTLTPLQSWKAGNADGWAYSWDLFFDELQQTDLPFQTADLTETNKKVALFTDTAEDGVAMGGLWESKAPDAGYEIAYRANFPVGTTDYAEYVKKAKESGADVIVAQMIPPDAFALWKQMKALAFTPKVAFCEKCSFQAAFAAELGPIAEGTIVSAGAAPEAGAFTDKFASTYGDTVDLTTVASAYTAAKVMLDAIAAAGSTDGAAINEAIGQTNADYPVGTVSFGDDHTYAIPAVARQWQGSSQVQVYPVQSGASLQVPVAGLQ